MASHRTQQIVLLLSTAALLSVAACGDDGAADTTATTVATTTTALPAMPADFDWWDPSPTPVGHGWVLERCTDDRPKEVLCFDHPDGRQGIVKLFRFLAPEDGDVNAHAGRFVQDFIADRKQGCGQGYKVKAEPILALEASGGPIKRYGFTGGATGGVTTERTVQWAGIRGPALEIVTISAYDPGSCIVPDGEGTLQALREVAPGIEALILASDLQGEPPR